MSPKGMAEGRLCEILRERPVSLSLHNERHSCSDVTQLAAKSRATLWIVPAQRSQGLEPWVDRVPWPEAVIQNQAGRRSLACILFRSPAPSIPAAFRAALFLQTTSVAEPSRPALNEPNANSAPALGLRLGTTLYRSSMVR